MNCSHYVMLVPVRGIYKDVIYEVDFAVMI